MLYKTLNRRPAKYSLERGWLPLEKKQYFLASMVDIHHESNIPAKIRGEKLMVHLVILGVMVLIVVGTEVLDNPGAE